MRTTSRTSSAALARARRGNALTIALLTVVALTGMAGAILATSLASKHDVGSAIARTRALYAAKAGISQAVCSLTAGQACDLGTHAQPKTFGDGSYWGSAVLNADGTHTVVAVGESRGTRRALQALIVEQQGGVFQNAIFAGNSGGDPTYTMKFGGEGAQADAVIGNVYSGHDVVFEGDATVNGTCAASGSIGAQLGSIIADAGETPVAPLEGVKQPIPDIAGMKYETHNDVDVAHEFKSASYQSGTPGGSAWELPAENPAHILRKDPSDRKTNWSSTAKEDYFLEDPHQPLHTDAKQDGTDCYQVAISDPNDPKTPGAVDGNQKVYFIDGNLWIHNLHAYSLQLAYPESSGLQITFVVKGNVYMSDNLFLADAQKDGIAFIAIKDEAEKDSGNIYFGDPTFGTLERMDAFMYAENDFFDSNLDAAGSAKVTLNGNMTAGNQVAINRDFGTQHSKLTVNFDDRIASGAIDLPGLPKQSGESAGVSVSLWREVAVPNAP